MRIPEVCSYLLRKKRNATKRFCVISESQAGNFALKELDDFMFENMDESNFLINQDVDRKLRLKGAYTVKYLYETGKIALPFESSAVRHFRR